MPLWPFVDARSAGVLPLGNSGVGSVSAPGSAPSVFRATTVLSLTSSKYKLKKPN